MASSPARPESSARTLTDVVAADTPAESRVDVPAYDRDALRPAVLHFSVGGFHRAHQAIYFDDLARRGFTDWGVVGVGLHSARMHDALAPQDGLYTVVEQGPDAERARIVGALVDYVYAPDASDRVLALLADPATKLVTLTITGDGYHVDRITPSTTPEDVERVAAAFGVDDSWPVLTEPFTQWVIEDAFCNDRPPLDRVGAQFVVDVGPFQTMKKRILNGTHTAIAYLGTLAGLSTTDEVMADPDFGRFVERLVLDEVLPLLPPVPDTDLEAYARTTLERLANPRMGDALSRLGRRGSTKVPDYLLPALREAAERDAPRELLTLAVAGWMRYLRGTDDAGETFEVQDARLEELRAAAERGGTDPRPLLAVESVFDSLSEDTAFAAALREDLELLDREGARAAVVARLGADGAGDDASAAATEVAASGREAPAFADGVLAFRAADLTGVRALLCDADGNLFRSEEPAFVASADVTNRFLAELGIDRRYEAEELRLATTGMNFRSTAVALAVEHGAALDEELAAGRDDHDAVVDAGDGRAVLTADALQAWVLEEQRAVKEYLAGHLRPDDAVTRPLERMAERYTIAAVSSSATPRLQACFGATALEGLFVPERTFSAEDSLPRPTSKPDPAIYRFAAETLGIEPAQGLAVEDSVTGARSAVGAGCPTLGNVQFVAEEERAERIAVLRDAGVVAVVTGWDVVERLLAEGAVPEPS